MKTKREVLSVEGFATKQGNGAHIMLPKDWLGKYVKVALATEPPPIKTKKELDDSLKTVDKHVKGLTREVKRNIRMGSEE